MHAWRLMSHTDQLVNPTMRCSRKAGMKRLCASVSRLPFYRRARRSDLNAA